MESLIWRIRFKHLRHEIQLTKYTKSTIGDASSHFMPLSPTSTSSSHRASTLVSPMRNVSAVCVHGCPGPLKCWANAGHVIRPCYTVAKWRILDFQP
jgi:hypothetical protein